MKRTADRINAIAAITFIEVDNIMPPRTLFIIQPVDVSLKLV